MSALRRSVLVLSLAVTLGGALAVGQAAASHQTLEPKADFVWHVNGAGPSNPSPVYVGDELSFVAVGAHPGDDCSHHGFSIEGYWWDFGDGTGVSQGGEDHGAGFVRHVYTAPGQYEVTLDVSSICGADSETKTLVVVPRAACFGLAPTIDRSDDDSGVNVVGTPGDDVIVTGTGADTVYGGGGDDVICTRGGDDFVQGGAGDDRISTAAGDDTAKGGAGNDVAIGGAGNDAVDGGTGDDVVQGQLGDDTLNGGDGTDRVLGAGGADRLAGNDGPGDLCRGGPDAGELDRLAVGHGCESVSEVP